MSKATELTNKIINHIYRQGGYAWRASSTGIYDQRQHAFRTAPKKGVSDVLGCFKGRLLAIEVKIGKDRLSDEQSGFLGNIENAGGLCFVAKDFDSFKDWWKNIVDVKPNYILPQFPPDSCGKC